MFVCFLTLSGLRNFLSMKVNLVHLREGRLKMRREGRSMAREMLRPATDTYHHHDLEEEDGEYGDHGEEDDDDDDDDDDDHGQGNGEACH